MRRMVVAPIVVLAVMLGMAAPSWATSTNLVRDASFESPQLVSPWADYAAGSKIGPWRVTAGTVRLMSQSSAPALRGVQSVNLDGSNGTPGTIQQTITGLMVGHTYKMLVWATGFKGPDGTRPYTFDALLNGSVARSFAVGVCNTQPSCYQTAKVSFTASATTATIGYRSTMTVLAGALGPEIDVANVHDDTP